MPLSRTLKDKKILLVDPDPWTRDSLSLLLRWWDCILAAYDSAEAGHEALDAGSWDIVICAHGSPGVDGLAFLDHCRGDHPEAVRILIGSFDDPRFAGDEGRAGHARVRKPLTAESIERALADAVGASGPST
jgi:DNA-binding NtrC family response regulator